MVFKGRFFSSAFSNKSSNSSSSPDGSNSPRTSASSPRRTLIRHAIGKKHTEKDNSKGKEAASPAKLRVKAPPATANDGGAAPFSPAIMAASLGLDRMKTRSGPLPQEGPSGDQRVPGISSDNLFRGAAGPAYSSAAATALKIGIAKKSGKSVYEVPQSSSTRFWAVRSGSGGQHWSTVGGNASSFERQGTKGETNISWNNFVDLESHAIIASELESPCDDCETEKESVSPRSKEIMRATNAPRKKNPADRKSYSHELSSKGVRPFPIFKPRNIYNLKEVLKAIQMKFEKAKEEVNLDLAVFAGDVVGIMDKNLDIPLEWQEILEDLLILARSCCVMSPGEFWLQCEGIVQDLDDHRQELPSGMLKKLYTHMLFILTRCTRLLQFHKESGFSEDEMGIISDSKMMHSAEVASAPANDFKHTIAGNNSMKTIYSRNDHCQEKHKIKRKGSQPAECFQQLDDTMNYLPSTDWESMASWKPPPAQNYPICSSLVYQLHTQEKGLVHMIKCLDISSITPHVQTSAFLINMQPSVPFEDDHKFSRGFCTDQQDIPKEGSIMCRICEDYVPVLYVEAHLKVCAIADSCDQKGLTVDERLLRISETLEKMIFLYSHKDLPNVIECQDAAKHYNSSFTEESDISSPMLSDLSQQGSMDMLDSLLEAENNIIIDDLKDLPQLTCKAFFAPKCDLGMTISSAESITPRSPLITPSANHIDMLLTRKSALSEGNDLPQLTDFGLSTVGLINSTADLSGPAVSGTVLYGEEDVQVSAQLNEQEHKKKRSAVGTPDYLAPEILLGTGHGASAD